MKRFMAILFYFCVLCVTGVASAAPFATVSTNYFDIFMEPSPNDAHPTIDEVSVLVRQLCAQLDEIFLRYSPDNVAKMVEEEQKQKAQAEGKELPARKASANAKIPTNRVIPKCSIYIFNTREALFAMCVKNRITPPSNLPDGFFTSQNNSNSIYIIRNKLPQHFRENILHETTHYYSHNFLPGGIGCYPQWFNEGLSRTYEKHIWNDDKLQIAIQPRIQTYDEPAVALECLQMFRTYLQNSDGSNIKTTPKPSKKQHETPIDPTLIQKFLDTKFTPESLRANGIYLKDTQEATGVRYAMYWAFGRFLIASRPDHLGAILRKIALWDKANARTFPRDRWFDEAWKIVAAEKPITVEEVERWLQENQSPFSCIYGDWQELGDNITVKVDIGLIAALALKNPDSVPLFTAFPMNVSKFEVGMVFNFIDRDNFSAIAVNEEGNVLLMQRQSGSWGGAKILGKANSIPTKKTPYPGSPAFHFAASQQNEMISVIVNYACVGTFPKIPNSTYGFFLGHTTGLFEY